MPLSGLILRRGESAHGVPMKRAGVFIVFQRRQDELDRTRWVRRADRDQRSRHTSSGMECLSKKDALVRITIILL